MSTAVVILHPHKTKAASQLVWGLARDGPCFHSFCSCQTYFCSGIAANSMLVLKLCKFANKKEATTRHGVNDNANSCNSPLNIAREEIPDLYSVKVHDHFPKLVGVHMNEQREQQQRSPMSHCPMLYYHYLFSCFRFHSISLTAISISSSWPNKIRSRSRHQVQIGDDLAMDEANSILMRANDQVTIMIWSSCRL